MYMFFSHRFHFCTIQKLYFSNIHNFQHITYFLDMLKVYYYSLYHYIYYFYCNTLYFIFHRHLLIYIYNNDDIDNMMYIFYHQHNHLSRNIIHITYNLNITTNYYCHHIFNRMMRNLYNI